MEQRMETQDSGLDSKQPIHSVFETSAWALFVAGCVNSGIAGWHVIQLLLNKGNGQAFIFECLILLGIIFSFPLMFAPLATLSTLRSNLRSYLRRLLYAVVFEICVIICVRLLSGVADGLSLPSPVIYKAVSAAAGGRAEPFLLC
jgi:hypothetical protein